MMKMGPPTVYVPAECLEDVKRLLLVFQRLDRGRQHCDLVGVSPGDEIELSREHVATVFPTSHTIPSRGFVVWVNTWPSPPVARTTARERTAPTPSC